jgi:hypothetical protein
MEGLDPVSLAISSVPELFKTINGVAQLVKAGQINPSRPLMKVPNAINEATNTARSNYYTRALPEQDYITGRIGAGTAQAIRAAQESGRTPAEIMQTLAGVQNGQNEALTNLAMEGARNQQQNANALYGQLDNQGNGQNLADDYNQRKPYAEQVAAKANLTQAGNTNIYGGLEDAAKGPLSGLTPDDKNNPLTGGIKGMPGNDAPTIVGPSSGIDSNLQTVGETSTRPPQQALQDLYNNDVSPSNVAGYGKQTPSTMLNAPNGGVLPSNTGFANMTAPQLARFFKSLKLFGQ